MYVGGVLTFLRPQASCPNFAVHEVDKGANAMRDNPPSSSDEKISMHAAILFVNQ